MIAAIGASRTPSTSGPWSPAPASEAAPHRSQRPAPPARTPDQSAARSDAPRSHADNTGSGADASQPGTSLPAVHRQPHSKHPPAQASAQPEHQAAAAQAPETQRQARPQTYVRAASSQTLILSKVGV